MPLLFISYLEFFQKFSYPLLSLLNRTTVTTPNTQSCIHSGFRDSSLHNRLFSLQGTRRNLWRN